MFRRNNPRPGAIILRRRIRALAAALAVAAVAATLLMRSAAGVAVADGPVLRATLDNGLRVVIVRHPLAPVVNTMVNYLVGSNQSPEGFPGTAHALEHMMFRGAPGLSGEQLASISAALGGDDNANTQEAVTRFYFTVPAENLDVVLHIESLRMRGISCTDAQWALERGAIEQEVASDLSNPGYVLFTRLREIMFPGTTYSHDALGTRPSFDKTTGEMLRNFHAQWYVPNNAILLIVGDVQPQAALATVKKLFGDIPSRSLPPRPVIKVRPVQPTHLDMTTDESSGQAVLCFRSPGTDSPDYAAAKVLEQVVANERGRLYALVTSGRAAAVDFSMDSLRQAGLAYVDASFPKGANGKTLLEEMKQVLATDLKAGFPADLVAAAKRHFVVDSAQSKNSIADLAEEWSNAVAIEGRQSPEDDVRAIQAVTVDDVNRVARKYLDFNHMVTAVLTPQDSGKAVSNQSFGRQESFASKETGPVELPAWAQSILHQLDLPTSAVRPTVSTLPNGLKLIVQSEMLTPTVSMYGQVRSSSVLQTPPGKEGCDEVLDGLFSYGSRTVDRDAFHKALDDIGADASVGTGFSVSVLTKDFPRGVELVADDLLHPGLPENAFKIVRKRVDEDAAGELESPDYLSERALSLAMLPPKDPLLRQTTPASVNSLSLDDVRRYHHSVFRPDMTTIVVIGDIAPEEAKKVISRAFGDWRAEGPKPVTDLPGVPINGPSAVVVPDSSRVQCKVVLAELVGLTRSNPDYYPLQLGNVVLGGAFYSTRLFRDLRKDNGLVYDVDPSFEIGKTRGMYSVSFGCDPGNVSKVRAIIQRDLKDMQSKPVTPEELEQAKRQVLREILLSEASTKAIADNLLHYATHDLPLDERMHAARVYRTLSAEKIQAAYAKWVRPTAMVQVVEGPAPK